MSILDQLGIKATGYGMQTAPKSNRPTYFDQLEDSKTEVTKKISGLFSELGKAYYEKHEDDHQTEYETQLTAIREAYAEIARFQQEEDEIAARKRCPACGAQLAEGSRFCNICGVKLPEAPSNTEQSAPDQRLCPKCKAVIGPDDLFCVSCGADLRDTAANRGL